MSYLGQTFLAYGLSPNYALKGTLRTSREFPGYDVGAGPLNAALDPINAVSSASAIQRNSYVPFSRAR